MSPQRTQRSAPDPLRDIAGRTFPLDVYKTAMDASPVTIVITDVNGVIQYANPKFTAITGYLQHEAVGMHMRIMKSGYHDEEFYRQLWNTIAIDKQEWHGIFKNKKKDGTFYWEEAWINPIPDANGEALYYVAVKEDITARRELEDVKNNLLKMHGRAVDNARLLQRLMITEKLPVIPGMEIAALYIPSELMSGDIFIIREHNNKLALILADCTGHGIEASMNANLLWRFVHSYEHMLHDDNPKLAAFLSAINEKLCEHHSTSSGYPTMTVAVIDTVTKEMHYSGAGSLPPYVFNNKIIRTVAKPQGPLLAVSPEVRYSAEHITLDVGDTVFLSSDAIFEEREHQGKPSIIGDDAFFQNVLRDYPDGSYVENIRYLFTSFSGVEKVGPLRDDTSMIMLRIFDEHARDDTTSGRSSHTLFL